MHEVEVATASISTQDIVICSARECSTFDIAEQQILNNHAVGWDPRRTAIQVILLHVDAVDADIRQGDVGVSDVGNEACGVVV